MAQYRDSTRKNYYGIWKTFNDFFIRLDHKPRHWEDRINLFVAYLIREKRKSTTINSYISAIKAVLTDANITINEDRTLLKSLIRACKINNDEVTVRLPIQKDLLNQILKTTDNHFKCMGQQYLKNLYLALFATAYYGLFRIGEMVVQNWRNGCQ